jgi:hypothetical protein
MVATTRLQLDRTVIIALVTVVMVATTRLQLDRTVIIALVTVIVVATARLQLNRTVIVPVVVAIVLAATGLLPVVTRGTSTVAVVALVVLVPSVGTLTRCLLPGRGIRLTGEDQ